MNTKELLGLKVKEYRKQKKLTQEQLSELINVDNGYISKLEIGQNFPSLKTLEKIADILDVDMYKFFLYTPEKNTDFKSEINKIYDKLSKEQQIALYQIAKVMK